jgi:hypothetical protein
MARVTVLISTMGDRINNIALPCFRSDVRYVVVHQQPIVPFCFGRDDVLYIASFEKGLSKSRNIAIKNCFTKYGFICDDDVVIDVQELIRAVDVAESNGADILACRFLYSDGSMNSYPADGVRHGIKSVASVCSIEILIKIDSLHAKSICFDERFGLGTSLPSGEEFIFLTDALRSGLEIRHSSCVVCVHPPVSSGMDFFSTKEKVLAKRYMLVRVFGPWAPFVMLVFLIKKSKVLLQNKRFIFFAKTFLSIKG